MIKFNDYKQHTKNWNTISLSESDVYIPTMKTTINPKIKISSRLGNSIASYYLDERVSSPWAIDMSLTDLGSGISYTSLGGENY